MQQVKDITDNRHFLSSGACGGSGGGAKKCAAATIFPLKIGDNGRIAAYLRHKMWQMRHYLLPVATYCCKVLQAGGKNAALRYASVIFTGPCRCC